MINGAHAVIYSSDAEALRAFFGNVLGLDSVEPDEGFGLVTTLRLPGGGELGLYEPRHPLPHA